MDSIVDPVYKSHVLTKLRQMVDNWPEVTPEEIATIRRLLLNPLNSWLARQKRDNSETVAGTELTLALEDLVNELDFYEPERKHVDRIERAWNEFQTQIGWGGLLKAAEQRPAVERDQRMQAGRRKGGNNSTKSTDFYLLQRNQNIADDARKLLAAGRLVVVNLAKKHELSERHIRNILKMYGINTRPKK